MKLKNTVLALSLVLAGLNILHGDDNSPIISVTSPPYCSAISGDTSIDVVAPGMSMVTAKCWQHGDGFGLDSTVATVSLDSDGKGSFVFPADTYPHGPITLRISGKTNDKKDTCYLQLYNKSGISWNEGMPKDPPPAAEGMPLVFADDFSGPLSISSTDSGAKYYDHKPPNGSEDFSTIPFTGYASPNNPFSRIDTYLRIRADANKNSAGLISSLKNDDTGIKVSVPCYFECRFIGPNAKGTWPAFWLMTDYMAAFKEGKRGQPTDELDIIEAYGGEGVGEPNASNRYEVTPHAWDQGEKGKIAETQARKNLKNPVIMKNLGIPSTWCEAFHTYGCKITATDTIYYCDNIEVGRHKTLDESKKSPFFFLINLATGGGWHVDLSRYHGLADMYVDYVRVYAGDNQPTPPGN